MNNLKKEVFIIGSLFVIVILSACGPSQAELDTTATQAAARVFATQTAEAPIATSTPIPTDTPTPSPIPTDTPTPSPIPTDTPTPSPIPTDTPGPTTGLISGKAFWENTDTPVVGVQLVFEEGVTTLGEEIITDSQGNYSAEVNPGSFSFTLNWPFDGQSDIPCSSHGFTLLGDWNVFPLVQLHTGGYLFIAFGPKLSVEAGDEVILDIQFSCQ